MTVKHKLAQKIALLALSAMAMFAGPVMAAGNENTPSETATAASDYDNGFVIKDNVVTYTITVKNQAVTLSDESAKYKQFTIKDDIPEGLEFVDFGDVTNAELVSKTHESGLVTYVINVANTEDKNTPTTASISFTAKVAREHTLGSDGKETSEYLKSYANTAVVSVDEAEMNSTTTTNYPLNKPVKKVYLAKEGDESEKDTSIDGKIVKAGDNVVYEITFFNTSSVTKDFVVTDKLPDTLSFVTTGTGTNMTKDGGNYLESGHTVTWNIKGLEAGSSKTLYFTAKVKDSAAGKIVDNTTDLTSDGKTVTSDICRFSVIDNPKKSVTANGKDVNDKYVAVSTNGKDSIVTYSIKVTNPSNEPKDFVITDTVPDGTEFVRTGKLVNTTADDGEYSESAKTITWKKTIAANTTITVSFDAKVVTEDKKIENTAYASVDTVKDLPSNTVKSWTLKAPVKSASRGTTSNMEGLITWAKNKDVISYKIAFTNNSDSERTFVIKDVIDADASYVEKSASNSGTYDAETKTLLWTVTLKAKESISVTFNVTVNASETAAASLTNTASVFEDSTDGPEFPSNKTESPIAPTPVKTVTDGKNDINTDAVSKNQEMVYTIHVENPSDAEKEYTVTDAVPAGTELVKNGDSYVVSDSGTVSDGVITWTMKIPGKGSHNFSFTVKALKEGSYIPNTAKVIVDGSTVTTNTTKNWLLGNPAKAVLEDGVDVNGKVFFKGDKDPFELTYTIAVKNDADVEKTFTVTDTIQDGATITSVSHNGSKIGQKITWKVKVAAGKTETLTVNVSIPKDTSITKLTNSADIEADKYKYTTNTVVNYFTDTPEKHAVAGSGMVDASKKIDDSMIGAGDTFTYQITWKNPTEEEQTYTVTDKLPNEVTFVSATDDGVNSNGTVTWKNVKVAAGAEKTVSIVVTAKDDTATKEISNKANVSYTDNPDLYKHDTNTVKAWVAKIEKDAVKTKDGKSIAGEIVSAGSTYFYDITVSNGSGKDQAVTVIDDIPAGLEIVEVSDNGTTSGNTVIWDGVTIPDSGKHLYVEVRAVSDDGVTEMKNTAILKNPQTGTTIESNEVVIYKMPSPVKKVDKKTATEGETIKYTIHVENPSKETKTFTITDDVDSKLVVGSISDKGKAKNRVITWTLTIEGGASKDVTFEAEVDTLTKKTTVTNTAVVSVDNTSINTNEVSTTLEPKEKEKTSTPKDSGTTTTTPSAKKTHTHASDNTTIDNSVKDTTAAATTEAAETATAKDTTVKNKGTGDSSNIPLYAGIAAVCAAGIAGVVIVSRKRKRK